MNNPDTKPSAFWHLNKRLTFSQVGWLVNGIEPQDGSQTTDGYEAVVQALHVAVDAGELLGAEVTSRSADDKFYCTIDVQQLKSWLISKGICDGFFFPQTKNTTPEYQNKSNPNLIAFSNKRGFPF